MNKKIELVGFIFCMSLLGGIFLTLYPKRLDLAMEDNVTRLAHAYAEKQLFKIMLMRQELEKAKDATTRKKLHMQVKKAANKAQQAADYAQKVADQAAVLEADSKKKGIKLLYYVDKARSNASGTKRVADYAQSLAQLVDVVPSVETKKEAMFTALESEI